MEDWHGYLGHPFQNCGKDDKGFEPSYHPDHLFWTLFQHITEFPDYLEFFEPGQIGKQIGRITRFYQKSTLSPNHPFKYYTVRDVDKFVDDTILVINDRLRERELIQPYT